MARDIRHRVTEHVHIKVEKWKPGARKPEIDEIVVKRIRSKNGTPASSIEELTQRVFGNISGQQRSLPGKKDK